MTLATHILRSVTLSELETLCGRKGVPGISGEAFALSADRFEGRVPGGAGRGIVAIRASAYEPRTNRPCAQCTARYSRGEG